MLIRWMLTVAAVAALAACAGDPHALQYVKASDPIWAVNPTYWNGDTNDITSAPTLPAGVQASSR